MNERLKTRKPKSITRADVLDQATFAQVRVERRSQIIALKNGRRVAVGPFRSEERRVGKECRL